MCSRDDDPSMRDKPDVGDPLDQRTAEPLRVEDFVAGISVDPLDRRYHGNVCQEIVTGGGERTVYIYGDGSVVVRDAEGCIPTVDSPRFAPRAVLIFSTSQSYES